MWIRIDGLRHVRGPREVLATPSLTIRGQRVTAILGPNGAGKTTLLRLLAGLDRPTAGTIASGESEDALRPGPATGRTAFAFQEAVLLSRSVRQNLDLALRLRRVPGEERARRIDHAARGLGLEELLDRHAGSLSGGEAQRVNLARALALEAPLTLLDEPLSGIDPIGRRILLDRLPGLLRERGTTTVVVTHDGEEALRLADDLVVLAAGRVRAAGTRAAVLDDPGDPEVAALLGYQIVEAEGRRIVVPPTGFRLEGPGRRCALEVECVVELLDRTELVGRIGSASVRVPLPAGAYRPDPGDTIPVWVAVERRL